MATLVELLGVPVVEGVDGPCSTGDSSTCSTSMPMFDLLFPALDFYMIEPLRRALDGVPACFPLEVMFFVIQEQLFRATDLQQSQRLKISDSKWTPI